MKRYPWRVVALCSGAVALAMPAKAPSVTFQGPGGGTRTIKVLHPEKLEGVSVGDTVEITYTEALALEVEEAPKP